MSIPPSLEYALDPRQRDLLALMVRLASETPHHNEFHLIGESGGMVLVHPYLNNDSQEDRRIYDNDFIELRDAGLVRTLSSNFDTFRIAVTKRGFQFIYEDDEQKGRDAVTTTLVVDEGIARREIRGQITLAHELLKLPVKEVSPSLPGGSTEERYSGELVATLEAGRANWYRYVLAMLRMRFSDNSQAEDFRQSIEGMRYSEGSETLEQRVLNISRHLLSGIRLLESLDQRLHFYVRPVAAAMPTSATPVPPSRKVFVVHGHDYGALKEVLLFLREVDLEPVVILLEAGGGNTIIEQIEKHGDVPYAVVILTPDDEGYRKGHPKEVKGRARQNVILELGYFMGKIRRHNVCALMRGELEKPSDYAGVLYVSMDDNGNWRQMVARNINISSAGIAVDESKISPWIG